MSRTLLLSTLIEKGACASQAELFRELFGDSVEITEDACLAVAARFDWDWAAVELLSEAARADYGRAIAPARADYVRAAYSVQADYVRAAYSVQADYESARAKTFARLFIADKE